MPSRFTSGQLARLRSEAEITRYANIFPSTREGYGLQVQQFVNFCRACNADPDFCNYDLVTLFFQYYVADVHGQQKVRASTTLVKFLSAWGSFAAENGLKFPEPGTPLRARITRFIKGVKNRYPHVPQQDVPLCIRGLKLIAADMGIRSATDLFHCDEGVLSRWARIITAHDACMRATEHCEGCRLSDVTDYGDYLTILVGSRACESKIKWKPRLAILFCEASHLHAGYVLRVLYKRVHGRPIRKASAAGRHRHGRPGVVPRHWRSVPTTQLHRAEHPNFDKDPVLFPSCSGKRPLRAVNDLLKRLVAACNRCDIDGIDTLNCLRAGGATDYFSVPMDRWWVCKQGGWDPVYNTVDIYNRPTTRQRASVAAVYKNSVFNFVNNYKEYGMYD